MAKETFFATLVVAFMSLFLISCEKSSFVGFEYDEEIAVIQESADSKTDVQKDTTSISDSVEEEVVEENISDELLSSEEVIDAPEYTPEVDKILPPEWGKIVGADISAVPADDEKKSCAKKCMVIRTELGAVAIVFDMDTVVPDEGAIVAGYFVEGNFSAEYNGGLYVSDHWIPAISKDMGDRIAYYLGDTCKRNIRNTTLKMWNWRDGNFTTVIDGYTFDVADGILQISYCGEQVMQIR